MLTSSPAHSAAPPSGVALETRCLAAVIPVFNEAATINLLLGRVLAQPSIAEVLVTDDLSTDGTWDLLQAWPKKDSRVRVFRHEKNRGKGAAVRTGMEHATAPVVIIQDADMEYDPNDYEGMLKLIRSGEAEVVYGSRFLDSSRNVNPRWHTFGNRTLTFISNFFSGLPLTDSATCYKMFRREVLAKISLEEERFGFCQEVTAKVAKMRVSIREVPVSYKGRTHAEGKKIRLWDGWDAVCCMFRYNWLRRGPKR